MLPRKGQYLKSELNLLKQHFQVPLRFPKDFHSTIIEKGKESGLCVGNQVESRTAGDQRARKEGLRRLT